MMETDLYHVLNRGVDKRNIVLDDKDRVRFLHDLFAFNDSASTPNFFQPGRHEMRKNGAPSNKKRDLLVRIHAFSLMNNHYHLLLSPIKENGIPLFMKKLNMGYTKYFNEKNNRVGALWQGKYKKIHIENDAHFLHIPHYIHLNCLDYVMPEWREGKITDIKKALGHLRSYRWSSHLDYTGIKNFPSITYRKELEDFFGSPEKYEKEMISIMTNYESAYESRLIEK